MVARVGILFCLAALTGLGLAQSPGFVTIEIGGPCTTGGNQCAITNSECIAEKCQCSAGYAAEGNNLCVKTCSANNECTGTANHICDGGRCKCPNNNDYVVVEPDCLPVSNEFGSACKSGPQCTKKWGDLAECSPAGKCTCQAGAVFDNDSCYTQISLVGDKCGGNKERCYLDDDGDNQHIECAEGKCKCKSGYTASTDNRKCSCRGDFDCTDAPNLFCNSGRCSCPADTHVAIEEECLPISTTFGSACKSSPQCTSKWGDLATCRDGRCSCQNEAVFNTFACYYKISLVGDNCNTGSKQLCYLDDDGNNQHVECVQGECKCNSGYTASVDKRKCIVPVFGSPCTSGPQCTHLWGDLATCSADGKCSCQEEAVFDKDACYLKITLVGDKCDTGRKQRCHLDDDGDNQNVECVGGECKCKSGYTASVDNRKCNAGALHLMSISSLLLVVLAKIAA